MARLDFFHAMRARIQTLLSFLLIAAGAALLFVGARDYFGARLGQTEAARDFERPIPASIEKRAAAEPASTRHVVLGDTLAKLKIPRLGTELYVVEGDGARELRTEEIRSQTRKRTDESSQCKKETISARY